MTTVGYGDFFPRSAAGYVIASVLTFVSMLFSALPVGIIGHVPSAVDNPAPQEFRQVGLYLSRRSSAIRARRRGWQRHLELGRIFGADPSDESRDQLRQRLPDLHDFR
ncbi:DNAH12 [Symbiodinium pilosum]|uniref:DNAH12 protein n=1 Tax=Symbiodinium pilosum TaxID=2952 RepID=A0A812XQB7_SYMPI|nr:DNAH12 [Symbiodinium pilosum]